MRAWREDTLPTTLLHDQGLCEDVLRKTILSLPAQESAVLYSATTITFN